MEIHSATSTGDVSLAQLSQKHFSDAARKNGVIDIFKYKKGQVK